MTTQVKGYNFFIEDGTVNFFKPLFKKLSRRGLKSMMYILMILSFILCTSAMHYSIDTDSHKPKIEYDTIKDQVTVNLRCNMPYQDIIGNVDNFLNACTLELQENFSKWSSLRCMHIEPAPLNDITPIYPTILTLLGNSKDCDDIKKELIDEKKISIQLGNFEMILSLAAIPVKVKTNHTSIPILESLSLLSNYTIDELKKFLKEHKVDPIERKKDRIYLQAIELIIKNASGLINDAFALKNEVHWIESGIKMYNDQLKNTANVIHMDIGTREIVDLSNGEYIQFYACVGVFSSTDEMMLKRREACTPHPINYHIPTHTLTVSFNYYQYHPVNGLQYLDNVNEYIKIDPVFLARDHEDNDRSIFLRVDHISKISFVGPIGSIPYPMFFLEFQIKNCHYYLKTITKTKNYQFLKIKENE